MAWGGDIDRITIGALGDSSPSNYWPDELEAVFIYDGALTDSEIASLYVDPYQMFGTDMTRMYAEAGEAPTGAPQVIHIIMSHIGAPMMVLVLSLALTMCRKRAA